VNETLQACLLLGTTICFRNKWKACLLWGYRNFSLFLPTI